MYNTAQKVLAANPTIYDVTYSYPNKHYMYALDRSARLALT